MSALGDRIRSQAAIADRPGQMAELERIADEVDALVTPATFERTEYRLVYDWPDGTQSVIDAASEGNWPPFGTTAAYLRQGWKRQRRAVTEWKEAR